jgi:hypothetical protein
MIPWNQTSWNYFLPRIQNSANIQNLKVVTVILKSRLLTISVYKRDSNYFTYVKFATRWFNLTIFSCHHCSLVRLLGHRCCFFPWSHLTRDENNKNIKGTKICLPAQWKKKIRDHDNNHIKWQSVIMLPVQGHELVIRMYHVISTVCTRGGTV